CDLKEWHKKSLLGSSCSLLANTLLREFVSGKKEAEFETRGVLGIRAVDSVVFDARSPLLPDSSLFGVRRVGGAHELPQIGDGIFFFQRQSDDRTARHECRQRIEE